MAQLRQQYDAFRSREAEIVAVCPEDQEAVSRFWAEQEIPFQGVADPEHEVARRFGQQVKILRLGRMPALLVVDRAGRIRYRHYARSMSDIPPNQNVLEILDALAEEREGHEPRGEEAA